MVECDLEYQIKKRVSERLRERTITLYTNKKEFKRQLKIPDEETIYIFLIDKNGRIIWRTNDKFTEEKAHDLENILEKYKTDSV